MNMLATSSITKLQRSVRSSTKGKQNLDVTCIILVSRTKSYGEFFLDTLCSKVSPTTTFQKVTLSFNVQAKTCPSLGTSAKCLING